jgi:DNA-binding response OmpR family regulator
MTILIADPDDEFVFLLTYWLRRHGQIPLLAQDRHTTLHLWRTHCPEVVVVDLALPETGRTAFCRRLRETGRGRILVLTDPRSLDEEEDALEQGADDFLAKPISMRRVSAHVDALARRTQRLPEIPERDQVQIGPTSVRLMHLEVLRQGRRARLTPIEGRLLNLLVSHAGQVLPSSTILQRIWGDEGYEPHLIKVHIHHLRQKIEPNPQHPRFLLTIPTVGYLLHLQGLEDSQEVPSSAVGQEAAPRRLALVGSAG